MACNGDIGTIADGSCQSRSRREEELMRFHHDDERQRDRRQPPSARRVAAERHRLRCRSSSQCRSITSSSASRIRCRSTATLVPISPLQATKACGATEATRFRPRVPTAWLPRSPGTHELARQSLRVRVVHSHPTKSLAEGIVDQDAAQDANCLSENSTVFHGAKTLKIRSQRADLNR